MYRLPSFLNEEKKDSCSSLPSPFKNNFIGSNNPFSSFSSPFLTQGGGFHYSKEPTSTQYKHLQINKKYQNLKTGKDQPRKQVSHGKKFYCQSCNRSYSNQKELDRHLAEHTKCDYKGCTFHSHPKIIELHKRLQHDTGLASKIMKLNTPEEIKKWREERRKNFPTAENVAKRQALKEEKRARGELLKTKSFGKMRSFRQRQRNDDDDNNKKPFPKHRRRMRMRRNHRKRAGRNRNLSTTSKSDHNLSNDVKDALAEKEMNGNVWKFKGIQINKDEDSVNNTENQFCFSDSDSLSVDEDIIEKDPDMKIDSQNLSVINYRHCNKKQNGFSDNEVKSNSVTFDTKNENFTVIKKKQVENTDFGTINTNCVIDLTSKHENQNYSLISTHVNSNSNESYITMKKNNYENYETITKEKILEAELMNQSSNFSKTVNLEREKNFTILDKNDVFNNSYVKIKPVIHKSINNMPTNDSIILKQNERGVSENSISDISDSELEDNCIEIINNQVINNCNPKTENNVKNDYLKENSDDSYAISDSDTEFINNLTKRDIVNDKFSNHQTVFPDVKCEDFPITNDNTKKKETLSFFTADETLEDSDDDKPVVQKIIKSKCSDDSSLHTKVGGSLGSLMADYGADSDSEDENKQKNNDKKSKQTKQPDKNSKGAEDDTESRIIRLYPVRFNHRFSLLEKLLAKEIRHERNVILQCVHYIVKRNFFDQA